MGSTARFLSLALGSAIASQSPASLAAEAKVSADAGPPEGVRLPSAMRRVSLEECLSLSERNYPKIAEARARLRAKESQRREAHTAPFSEFTFTAGGGVLPIWRGTSIYSPSSDAALSSELALAYQLGIEGVVPLFTFGKLTSLWEAADAQVKLGEHDIEREKNLVRIDVVRAYFGLMLAHDAALLLAEVRQHLEKELGKLDPADDANIDALKLRMYGAEVEAKQSEAKKGEAIARAGLRFLTGISGEWDVLDQPLRKMPHILGPLARYLEAARLHRPEINMVKAGLVARNALLDLERAKYFPDLGVGISGRLSRTPEFTDQRNPFSYDPANQTWFGAGLVLRWKLDFLPQSARVARAEAELEEMRAVERFALGGIAVEVEKAFAEAKDAETRLMAFARATGYAKKWLIQVQQGSEMGLTEADEMVEPAKEYALKKYAEMNAVYELNVALAALSLATGWDGILAMP